MFLQNPLKSIIILTSPLTFKNILRVEKFNVFHSTALEESKMFNGLYLYTVISLKMAKFCPNM